jgi:hypothetical protein
VGMPGDLRRWFHPLWHRAAHTEDGSTLVNP